MIQGGAACKITPGVFLHDATRMEAACSWAASASYERRGAWNSSRTSSTASASASVYAIIALGYTMVYGIAKMLNFAHGDVIMVGAYISFCSVTAYLGLPTVLVRYRDLRWSCARVLGIVMERLAYKPLRNAPSLDRPHHGYRRQLSVLQNAALLIMGLRIPRSSRAS